MLKLNKILAVAIFVLPFSGFASDSDNSNAVKVEDIVKVEAVSKQDSDLDKEAFEKINEELRLELQNEILAPDCMVVPFCNG